jgi:hypothetical protein
MDLNHFTKSYKQHTIAYQKWYKRCYRNAYETPFFRLPNLIQCENEFQNMSCHMFSECALEEI